MAASSKAPAVASSKSWYQSVGFNNLMRDFHDRKARFPKIAMKEAKEKHEEIMNAMRDYLNDKNIIINIQYTGSSYEGIKVDSSDLEFDCMVVMFGGTFMNKTEIKPGYVALTLNDKKRPLFKDRLDENGLLDPAKVKNQLEGELQECLNSLELTNIVKLVKHGPAIQMNVKREEDDTHLWYSVDIVPTYKLMVPGGPEFYVAKPIDDKAIPESKVGWRRSFSLEEKNALKGIDAVKGNNDDGCRKQCIRILKVLREKDATLRVMPSYFFKTTLLHEDQKTKSEDVWNQKKIGWCVVRLLQALANAVDTGNLPNFFLPGMNILPNYEDMHRKNMLERLRGLVEKENKMHKLMKSVDPELPFANSQDASPVMALLTSPTPKSPPAQKSISVDSVSNDDTMKVVLRRMEAMESRMEDMYNQVLQNAKEVAALKKVLITKAAGDNVSVENW